MAHRAALRAFFGPTLVTQFRSQNLGPLGPCSTMEDESHWCVMKGKCAGTDGLAGTDGKPQGGGWCGECAAGDCIACSAHWLSAVGGSQCGSCNRAGKATSGTLGSMFCTKNRIFESTN